MRFPHSVALLVSAIVLHPVIKLRLIGLILITVLLLSGCVKSKTGIHFVDANHGEVVQHIRLKAQHSPLNESMITTWVESLEQRTLKLGGKVRHPAPAEWILQLPFYNAKDLEYKFNQLLQPQTQSDLSARLQLGTLNRLLWQRHHLQYDLDLRSLRVTLQNDFRESLDLEFALQTPWGARVPTANSKLSPTLRKSGWQLVWKLQPGMMNHIEAVFLVPSPIGIGVVIISLLVLLGAAVKVLSRSSVDIVKVDSEMVNDACGGEG